MNFQKATPEERKIYYTEEWSARELPDFIRSTIAQREFGFDHDGSGPSDRYNAFRSAENLEKYMRANAPFAAYSSISFYEKPQEREGWFGAELVFDIDAKDLPMRRCRCVAGSVCEVCLEDAKQLALLITETLREDLALREIRHVYSGRGYHIRILDEKLMKAGSAERGCILDYVSGGVIPGEERHGFKLGYPRVFRGQILRFIQLADVEKLRTIANLSASRAEKIIKAKWKIANEIEEGKFETLREALGKKGLAEFLEHVRRTNAEALDGKVTIDVKRILRLPSSLHSGASMKCMEVKSLEKFQPLRDAVPKFVRERGK